MFIHVCMKNYTYSLFLVLFWNLSIAQTIEPNYIKSVQIRSLQSNNNTVFIPLHTGIELSFDDLEGDQKDYYYKIELMNYDWTPNNQLPNQYIEGFQSNSIINVENSFNTLQNFTHYTVQFPNQNTRITKSGNYVISVIDETDEVIFSRKVVLYEDLVSVGVLVSRGRDTKNMNQQQNVQFTVNHPSLKINIPNQEIHVAVLQNQNWKTTITDIEPNFFKPNQLIYRYTQKLNFWGGNEYLFFDTKNMRNTSLNVRKVERKDVFYNYLFPHKNQPVKTYSFNPDINGQFIIRTIEANNPRTEADYALMHFTLSSEQPLDDDVYVYGAFNNFELTDETKMSYNPDNKAYTSKILLKQGFYNFTYVTKNNDNIVSQSEIRGNFSQTENEYTVLVYYKPMGALFDRVVGLSTVKFEGNR